MTQRFFKVGILELISQIHSFLRNNTLFIRCRHSLITSLHGIAGTSVSLKDSPSGAMAADLLLGILVKKAPISPNKANTPAKIQVTVKELTTPFLNSAAI